MAELTKETVVENPGPFHIISMDGGGIYGLATADLLKQLCQADPKFLRKEDMWRYMFAGTSAGAINALLLAQQDDPREYILAGGLHDFWKTSPIFDPPTDFWTWYWSFIGLTPWFGSQVYLDSLKKTFGEHTKVSDLPHNVFVCVFNYFGMETPEPAGGTSWGPRFYSNFIGGFEPLPEDAGGDLSAIGGRGENVVRAAYGATSPAGYRGFVNGLGDGGAAVPSPELYSVLGIGRDARKYQARLMREKPELAPVVEALEPRVSLLSLGVCTTPWYCPQIQHCTLGYNAFWNWFPTNALRGNWYPPTYDFSISAPTSTSNQEARALLGAAYFRLNPALFGPPGTTPPELLAMAWARDPQLRNWLIDEIEKAVETETARNAVSAALSFLDSPGWRAGIRIDIGFA